MLIGMCLILWASTVFAGLMVLVASVRFAQIVGVVAAGGRVKLAISSYHSWSFGDRVLVILLCHLIAFGLAIGAYLLSVAYFKSDFNVVSFASVWSCSMAIIFSFPAFLLPPQS